MATKKRKTRRPPPPLPAPRWSSRLYLRLPPARVGMFRFLLEAEDNLGYMSVVDRWEAVLQVVFSPHQEQALRRRLDDMRELLPFTFVGPGPGSASRPCAASSAPLFTPPRETGA